MKFCVATFLVASAAPSASSLLQRHEALMKEQGTEMTLEKALQTVKLPEFIQRGIFETQHGEHSVSLLQGESQLESEKHHAKKKEGGFLDRVRHTLNEMYEEAQNDLDVSQADATLTIGTLRTQLDENTGMRTAMAEAIAGARAQMAESTGVITEANSELGRLRQEVADHNAMCDDTTSAAQAQIAILEADVAVGEKVKNMTKCDPAAVSDAQGMDMAFMQCRKGSRGGRFTLGGKASGLASQFKSQAAEVAMQRAAKIAMHKPLGRHRYKPNAKHAMVHQSLKHKMKVGHKFVNKNTPSGKKVIGERMQHLNKNTHVKKHGAKKAEVFLQMAETKKAKAHIANIKVASKKTAHKAKKEDVDPEDDSAKLNTEPANEDQPLFGTFEHFDNGDACSTNGCVAIKGGKTSCDEAAGEIGFELAAATDVAEGELETTPIGCSIRGLATDGTGGTLVFNPAEAEDIITGAAHSDQVLCRCAMEEESEDDLMARLNAMPVKCSVAGAPNCPDLYDAISTMVAEVADALYKVKTHLADTEVHCKAVAGEYGAQIGDWELSLNMHNVKLAEATETLNTNEEQLRLRVQEFRDLRTELKDKVEDCATKQREALDTMCGLKTVRTELYQMSGDTALIQDCQVSDWVEGECSVACGGGSRLTMRSVVQNPNMGAACPPLSQEETCNDHACPIDCVMDDWTGWSECSKDCGTGVEQRVRNIRVEPQDGGADCDAKMESRQCNAFACDVDCVIADWSEWTDCSKACSGGLTFRRKYVAEEAVGQGRCADEEDETRLETDECNEDDCPDNLVCTEKVDVMLLLDASGSVGWWGWEDEVQFARDLMDRLTFGENGAKAGILAFGSEISVTSQLSFDRTSIDSALDSIVWQGSTTNTAEAIATGMNVLAAGGRADAESVVFLMTDGNPDNAESVAAAAEVARQTARVIVVQVGPNVDYELAKSWASYPSQQNVLYAEDFGTLLAQLPSFVADLCDKLGCNEEVVEEGQHYIGCQAITQSGITCQAWTAQMPHYHGYTPQNFPWTHLGDHNYCRNPDPFPPGYDDTIWCITMDEGTWWEYCAPLTSSEFTLDHNEGFY